MNNSCRKALETWKSCQRRKRTSDEERPVTLAGVVRSYRRNYQLGARAEIEYYGNLPSLKEVIIRASRAERPDGKRHDHQTRIRRIALKQVERRLTRASLRFPNSSFADLHRFLDLRIGTISGIGELMIYDTALRVGAKLGVEPEAVFLHRGTRRGIKALGLGTSRPFVEMHELPKELRALRPHEVEDCVCIYKDELASGPI